jgi:DNA-binding NarL/FixJ family response regulator
VPRLLTSGCSTRAVTEQLVIAEQMARVHIARILHKLDAHNRTQALNRTRDLGLV